MQSALDRAISAHVNAKIGVVKNNFSKGVESNYEAIKEGITLVFRMIYLLLNQTTNKLRALLTQPIHFYKKNVDKILQSNSKK